MTAETWILPDKQATQTVFSQGSINGALELAVTSDNYLQVTVGGNIIKSSQAFAYKAGEWAHVALEYNASSKTVSAFYNFVEMIHNAPVNIYTGIGHFEFGRSIRQQGNYFAGNMHELRVWSDTLSSIQIQINSLTQFSGGENGLLAYYPMNEGKGTICFDKAHGSNAKLKGQWSTPAGKSVSLNGNGYVKVNTSFAHCLTKMDYTIELWFKGSNARQMLHFYLTAAATEPMRADRST